MAKEKNPSKLSDSAVGTKRTSFILRTEISRKLNIISAMDNVSITELVNKALTDLYLNGKRKTVN